MKTKEQVLEHLKNVGYSKKSVNKIMGFLIGVGLKENEEEVIYKKGEESFEYFLNWFNNKEVKKTKLEAYKEIVDFLMSNCKEVPSYWLEYLNNDIKTLDYLNKLGSEPFIARDTLTSRDICECDRIAQDTIDAFKRLEIFFSK